jgi:diguanylate cyclase (GGDEF)-like protein/PAS domain S-box-containing protein
MSAMAGSTKGKGRILVVDDTPANLRLLMDMLSEHGYLVHPASGGEPALRFVQTNLPDLILLDIMMPGMDGFQVCEQLKTSARTHDIPVIFLSAADQLLDKVKAFASGGVDYIVKPFQVEEVLARIETHLLLRSLQKNLEKRVLERTVELVESNVRLTEEIAERKRAEARFYKVFHASPTPMVVARANDGVFVDVNQATVRMSGYSRDELVGKNSVDIGLLDRDQLERALSVLSEQGVVRNREFTIRTKAGEQRVFLGSIEAIDLDGVPCRISTFIDITERKQAEEELRKEEERFRYVSLATRDAIYDWDIRSGTVARNAAYQSLYAPNQPLGTDPNWREQLIHADDRERVMSSIGAAFMQRQLFWSDEYRLQRADGDYAAIIDRGYVLYDATGTPVRMIGAMADMTERKRSEERLNYVAHHDLLTGLPNRALLYDRLQHAMIEAGRHGRLVGVVFLDLDRFKTINDTLGHAAGDALLKEVSQRLKRCVREGDTVARLSGDEFALVLTDMAQIEDAARLAQKILDVFLLPVQIGTHEIFVTASLGITLYPFDDNDTEALLRNADVAMYRAKQSGRSAYHFYTVEMTSQAAESFALENELHQAIERDELLLNYQPIVSADTGAVLGVEALARWKHPQRGMVGPEIFIPLAEETGLIVPLGEWVLREACAQCLRWQHDGHAGLRVSVNLSARQFQQANFAATVRRVLEESGLDSKSLELEITESLLLKHEAETLETLRALADMGVALAIDDFGTGYSSLSYLKRFPVKVLKIDQSFTRDIPAQPDAAAIAQAIISMAHALGLSAIAEGVETREQREFLRTNRCDALQGNFFSKAVPASELKSFLGASTARAARTDVR